MNAETPISRREAIWLWFLVLSAVSLTLYGLVAPFVPNRPYPVRLVRGIVISTGPLTTFGCQKVVLDLKDMDSVQPITRIVCCPLQIGDEVLVSAAFGSNGILEYGPIYESC